MTPFTLKGLGFVLVWFFHCKKTIHTTRKRKNCLPGQQKDYPYNQKKKELSAWAAKRLSVQPEKERTVCLGSKKTIRTTRKRKNCLPGQQKDYPYNQKKKELSAWAAKRLSVQPEKERTVCLGSKKTIRTTRKRKNCLPGQQKDYPYNQKKKELSAWAAKRLSVQPEKERTVCLGSKKTIRTTRKRKNCLPGQQKDYPYNQKKKELSAWAAKRLSIQPEKERTVCLGSKKTIHTIRKIKNCLHGQVQRGKEKQSVPHPNSPVTTKTPPPMPGLLFFSGIHQSAVPSVIRRAGKLQPPAHVQPAEDCGDLLLQHGPHPLAVVTHLATHRRPLQQGERGSWLQTTLSRLLAVLRMDEPSLCCVWFFVVVWAFCSCAPGCRENVVFLSF